MPRRGGGKGKYKSLKTGKYVSAYYALRHPKIAVRVDREAGSWAEEETNGGANSN